MLLHDLKALFVKKSITKDESEYELKRNLTESEFDCIFGNASEKPKADLPTESKYVITNDDNDTWKPCYAGNKLEVSISMSWYEHYYVKVTVWGADDFGVELVYSYCGDRDYADYIYNHYKKYIYDKISDGVTIEWLYEHGFVNF